MSSKKLMVCAATIVALSFGATFAKATARPADVSGTYVGPLEMEGQPAMPTTLELKQDGDKLTGRVGDPAKPEEMFPVTGSVDGDDVTISAKHPQMDVKVEFKLKYADDHLKGTGTFTVGDMKMAFKTDMTKK